MPLSHRMSFFVVAACGVPNAWANARRSQHGMKRIKHVQSLRKRPGQGPHRRKFLR
ncbi:hypothetical protein BCAR13_60110 [Paraburkholderia caribensis]|nr:hypothetical protein BCAR13_60110 [Paraburkholderia caribensis]